MVEAARTQQTTPTNTPRGIHLTPTLRSFARAAVTVAGIAIVAAASPVIAQETREDQLAAQQAKKATELRPYEPTQLERRLERAERLDSSLFATGPVYSFIGTAFDGGGIAAGPGFRARFGDTGSFDAHAAWSIKNYKAAGTMLNLPAMAHNRVTLAVRANWVDAPEVAFYGRGNQSTPNEKGSYSYTSTTIGLAARLQATPTLAVGGGVDALLLQSGLPSSGASVQELDTNYRRSFVFAERATRTSPGYTRRGSLLRVDFSDYQQTNSGSSNFQRVDAEAQQFIPVLRENWVIALRALTSSTITASGDEVPYFMLPDLGGSHTLRGYPAWRFRDRNRMLLTGEYRWTAGSLVDMALFMDAGKVSPSARDLNLHDLKMTYGVGVSLHTPIATVTRLELARTSEGTSLVLSFGPSF